MESGAIPDHMLAGTSSFGVGARLNGRKAWLPRHDNLNQYLVVDFGSNTIVTGISSQGRHNADQYVTGYYISVNYRPKTGVHGYYKYKVGGLLKVQVNDKLCYIDYNIYFVAKIAETEGRSLFTLVLFEFWVLNFALLFEVEKTSMISFCVYCVDTYVVV